MWEGIRNPEDHEKTLWCIFDVISGKRQTRKGSAFLVYWKKL